MTYSRAFLLYQINMQSSFTSNYLPKNPFKTGLGHFVLRLLGGWKIEGNLPENLNKYVIIVAHHTSNWDFVIGVAVKLITRIRVRFFAKHSLFVWPLGILMRRLGGIPIERDKSINRVDQAITEIKSSEHFVLVIAPEGTRSKVQKWKTGFYHIANGANVPVVPIAFDFQKRKVIMGSPMSLTGNIPSDFERMHEFFLSHPGKHPELGCDGPFETPNIYSK
ncbi:lysophospholipid acyltransferase family protein [Endozoicomonas atrinae]|uniref:lysophospholipid acyltransferase family protein n=1 Tax=Endozoicomonas atrinae TaxID=1333660 RepID=UPI001EE73304|nr:lysophospholipid acyltransferase family protein [Endozoicomonas atrinae]